MNRDPYIDPLGLDRRRVEINRLKDAHERVFFMAKQLIGAQHFEPWVTRLFLNEMRMMDKRIKDLEGKLRSKGELVA